MKICKHCTHYFSDINLPWILIASNGQSSEQPGHMQLLPGVQTLGLDSCDP
jgi:hypothetical protein